MLQLKSFAAAAFAVAALTAAAHAGNTKPVKQVLQQHELTQKKQDACPESLSGAVRRP
ncbi:hypothetical protein LB559_24075 [Mesorhizobium sp. BR1-1-3]|uniref:hypothetical protein n=1 Tax=Mesorhizobium sp. BR1-1-3 TaxID=2876651 RepID=UPI001CD1671F|nr:hypothetical protein [Mesorhizobium sp. BR1-1-3]MBZ9891012.1 hypothetical protein [Mesorhizobium sp. BR1-1-3]